MSSKINFRKLWHQMTVRSQSPKAVSVERWSEIYPGLHWFCVSRFYDWLRKFAPLFFPPIVVWSKIFAPLSRLIVHWRCVTSPGSLIGQKNFSQFSRLIVFLLALFDCCYSFCDTKLKKRSELMRLVMNVDKKILLKIVRIRWKYLKGVSY